jgi:hypothetical protein
VATVTEAPARQCGGCTLCCKLVPVEQLEKPAGVRCKHQRSGKGCMIYAKRPWSCREWTCLWIKGTDTNGQPLALSRPDRVHYVIDEVPDIVRTTNSETGETLQLDVMQVWVDPLYPDAHQDPALRELIDRVGIVALIRYDSMRGFALFPPSRSTDGQWHVEVANSAEDLREAQRKARFEFWRRGLPTG